MTAAAQRPTAVPDPGDGSAATGPGAGRDADRKSAAADAGLTPAPSAAAPLRAPLRDRDALLVAEGIVVEHGIRGARARSGGRPRPRPWSRLGAGTAPGSGAGAGTGPAPAPGAGQVVQAVSDVSLDLLEGETLGIVGESGCGKSSLGRALLQLPPPTAGTVRLEGEELTGLDRRSLRRVRSRLQMIFQDPLSSLNPRRRAHQLVSEPIMIASGRVGDADRARVRATFEAVGLDPVQVWDRHPSELSGGQCQRLCIARALVAGPSVLVCDEPVSALDVSVQAQILNLLEEVKAANRLSLLFIAHDLAVVKNISDRVMVMYLGRVCEVAPAEELFRRPLHPYTDVLISSIPDPDPDHVPSSARVQGELPSPVDPPSGCRFRTRCPRADAVCAAETPAPVERAPDHWVACHHVDEGALVALSPSSSSPSSRRGP